MLEQTLDTRHIPFLSQRTTTSCARECASKQFDMRQKVQRFYTGNKMSPSGTWCWSPKCASQCSL